MESFELENLAECMVCGSRTIEAWDPDAALSKCRSCGYIFDNPRPTFDEIVRFYSKPTKYNSWLLEEEARVRLWERRLRKMSRVARPGSLLDVGAGTGQFLDLARRDHPEVWGTEVSESAVAIAQEKYRIRLLHGTIESLPLPAEAFDNITVFHVLEHVPNPRRIIEKCFSLLRRSGLLFIAVPNDYRPVKSKIRHTLKLLGVRRYREATRSGLQRIQLDGSMAEIHLSHFTPRVLRFLLESSGFKVVRESIDPYYVPCGGLAGIKQDLRYLTNRAIHGLSGVNTYDTIWMVAQKQE
jgi:SAM-dependent methyltransferase